MADRTFEVGKPIKKRTNFRWNKKGPVRHFLLTFDVEVVGTDKSLKFKAVPQHEPGDYPIVDNLEKMKEYAESLFVAAGRRTAPTTPYDVTTQEPCWVLFELDPKRNWQFSSQVAACSTKFSEPPFKTDEGYERYGHNWALHHVYEDGGAQDPYDDDTPPKAGCRIIFFAVVHRNGLEMQGMNLMVEFYQDTHLIPVIIDPDVGNDGNEGFPDPP